MPNRNKAKGNAFERKVCELLMSEYGGTWRRSPTSGAFFGGSNFHRLEGASISQAMIDVGDIIPPADFEGVVIECKSRKTFSFNLLLSSSTELESWIDQAQIDYQKFDHSAVFMVIFKVNRKGMYVVTLKDELPDNGNTGIEYYYNDEIYNITVFDEQWLARNKDIIKKRCNEH
jgi:Holliday junction resolvase